MLPSIRSVSVILASLSMLHAQGLTQLGVPLRTTAAPPGSIGLAVAGRIAGSGYPDVVQVIDGVPHLLNTPALFGRFETIPGPWSGVTGLTVCNGGPTPCRQQVVIADAAGVHVFTYLDSGKSTTALPFGDWAGARCLSGSNLDIDPYDDVAALSASGTLLLVLRGSPAGLGHPKQVVLPGPADALACVPWGGAHRQVAMATGGSLLLFSPELTEPTEIATSTEPNTVALLPVRADGGAWKLFWCTQGPGGIQLTTLDATSSTTVSFTGHDLVAGACGDFDGDGDDDVVLSQRNNHRALVLVHRGYGFSYYPSDVCEVPLVTGDSSQPAPANNAHPVVADLENDGDADLVHGLQSAGQSVAAFSFAFAPDGPRIQSVTLGEQGDLDLTLATTWQPPAGATHIDVLRWRMVKDAGSYQVVADSGVRFPLALVQNGVLPTTGFDPDFAYLVWLCPVVRGAFVEQVFAPAVAVMSGNAGILDDLLLTYPGVPILIKRKTDGGEIGGGYIGTLLPPPPSGGGTIPPGG
jgi:hypothetical protein